jgi:hypothetical protein
MLVSVGRLNDNGFSMTFSGGKCTISGPDGACGRCTKEQKNKERNGLYKGVHEPDEVNAAIEVLIEWVISP